jgi:hypothetical protein
MNNWTAGDAFIPMDTDANRACGISTEGSGYVTCVLGSQVSFFVDRGRPIGGRVEASCDLGTFSANFKPHPNLSNCTGYNTAGVTGTRYPDDLKRR